MWQGRARATRTADSVAMDKRLFIAYSRYSTKKKRLATRIGSKPLNCDVLLEAELQAELHFASVEGSGSLTEVVGLQRLVVSPAAGGRHNEVGAIEDVERLRVELQVEPFR